VDHWILPLDLSQEQPMGVILHLKLMDDFIERSRRFESEGQHAGGALAYKTINERVAEMPGVNFFHAHSRRYRGPKNFSVIA
jgi:hypothetical protein